MIRYLQIQKELQGKIDKAPMFFAFSDDQFRKGMEKLGLDADSKEDRAKIAQTEHGGFILKTAADDLKAAFQTHAEQRAELFKNPEELKQSLIYELNNHEYSYTGDPTDAVQSLGLTLAEIDPEILRAACNAARAEAA